MKLPVKFLSLVLALIMLMSVAMLTSCNNNTTPKDTTAGDGSVTTPGGDITSGSDVTSAPSGNLELIIGGQSNVTVIRNEDADPSSVAVSQASALRTTIGKLTGVTPGIDTDWVKRGEEHDPNKLEILVGYTDYNETAEALAQINLGEYVVKVIGRKLVVAGYTDDAIETACRQLTNLLESIAKKGELIIPADTLITGVTNKMLNILPGYENGTFSATYKGGNNSTQLIFKNTTPEAYAAYVSKLESAGFKTYTTNTITDNEFATLNNDSYTVNIGYYAYEKSTRLIIEPLADPVGLKEDNVYTPVTTSQITMFGLQYYNASKNETYGNGLSMLIRLTDGRFVVIDGGFNRTADAQLLLKALQDQSKDYITAGQKITIAAWIITHAHGDHSGMIGKQYSSFRSIKVEKFVVNFMSDEERNKAIGSTSYSSNWGSGEGGGWTNVITAANALGAKVQYVRVGQVLYIADLKMEVLYTIDSYAPKICNAFNTTSLIIKMTFGDSTTFLMTGDATGAGFQIAASMYGTYLKCDILQVAHHGYTTWGNDSGTISAYRYAAPSTLLWPQGSAAFPNYKNKAYNVVLFSPETSGGTNKNFKECLVAGLEGESIVVPIPYTAGNAVETRISN